ncbi:hypothetical protein [uncultured Polaribacter sp.]|uniref:hypothetical protein n=1 Tax=uncultured Polaribacter sp. TaxID=174711 RepID=UPI00259B061C|nr:hypothetical protein [uncultured Polaribacter sp.]
MKKYVFIVFIISNYFSCNSPKLNGHYHVEWGNRSSFQTWNIKNNRMKINDSVCSDKKEICFGMPIKFKGDSIFVTWVDIIYAAKFKIDENGTIITTTNYDDRFDTIKLIPKENCINSKDYLNKKVSNLKTSFDLVSLYYNTHGESAFPIDFKNELIIGKKENNTFYIFNNQILTFSKNSFNITKQKSSKDILIYIDKKIRLKEVVTILKELTDKNYKIHFSSKDEQENNEQVIVFNKSIKNIKINKSITTINTCEYCEKHPTKKIDSILKFKIFKKDSCLVNNQITDYFQLRNSVVRFLKQNRSTRLNTQIQLEINSDILFEDYLYLLGDINFVNIELLGTYYRDESDPDQKNILERQETWNTKNLNLEFPIRIKEIIKSF